MKKSNSIKKNAGVVNKFLKKELHGNPKQLYDAASHLILHGGKRLRPFLVLKSCQMLGGRQSDAMAAASAVEMIHNFTLVHDDIMDNDEMRHGVPTTHKKFDMPLAILAGDVLYSKAYHTISSKSKLPSNYTRLEYIAAFKVGLEWLGIKYDEEKNTSDNIELHYDKCSEMIGNNHAYVCTCKRDNISKNRREMVSCKCSMGDLKQNEERWKKMFNKYKPGEAIIRFRGDMESKNTVMRDPVLFRIIDARHPLLFDKYRVWPSYDFAVAIEDSIDGITHAFRSKEYELRNELYYAILDALNMRKPKMLEFSRLEFKGMPVSKRIIRPLMEKGKVSSLDDPRLPTLAAMLRRGITPEAIRKFTTSLGFTKADTLAPFDSLEAFNRTIIDKTSIRLFMVKAPKILTINNLPNSVIELPNHPSNDLGTRQVEIENGVLLSSEDAKELEVGSQLRLMGLGNVKITSIKSEITGEFTDDDHNVNFRKVQWVSQKTAHKLKILIPHQLFIDDEFNEGSLEEIHAYTEPHYLELKEGTEIQFVRFGYCRKDSVNQAIFTHK